MRAWSKAVERVAANIVFDEVPAPLDSVDNTRSASIVALIVAEVARDVACESMGRVFFAMVSSVTGATAGRSTLL